MLPLVEFTYFIRAPDTVAGSGYSLCIDCPVVRASVFSSTRFKVCVCALSLAASKLARGIDARSKVPRRSPRRDIRS